MIPQEQKSTIHDYLVLWYRSQWTQEHTEALCGEFSYLAGSQLLEACQRHIRNSTGTAQGEAAGHWPPKPADIEAQLMALNVERMRAAQEERLREIRRETDETYQGVMGQRQSKTARARIWCAVAGDEMQKAAKIRQALEDCYSLDPQEPLHMHLLMAVLTETKHKWLVPELGLDVEGLMEIAGAVLVAEEIATRLGISRRQGTAAWPGPSYRLT